MTKDPVADEPFTQTTGPDETAPGEPRSWSMWAGRRDDLLVDIGNFPRYVLMHGYAEAIPVRVTEDPNGPHYGWLATGEEVPSMIHEHPTLFRICFPYGVETAVEYGQGQVLRLRVAERD